MRTRKIDAKKLRREPWLTASIKLSIDRNKKLYAKMLWKDINVSSYKEYNKASHTSCQKKLLSWKMWGL